MPIDQREKDNLDLEIKQKPANSPEINIINHAIKEQIDGIVISEKIKQIPDLATAVIAYMKNPSVENTDKLKFLCAMFVGINRLIDPKELPLKIQMEIIYEAPNDIDAYDDNTDLNDDYYNYESSEND